MEDDLVQEIDKCIGYEQPEWINIILKLMKEKQSKDLNMYNSHNIRYKIHNENENENEHETKDFKTFTRKQTGEI
jgi:hypothetical protein